MKKTSHDRTRRVRRDVAKLIADVRLNLADRQLVLWESLSAKSGIVTMSLTKQCQRLGGNIKLRRLMDNAGNFVRAGFYEYDRAKKCYRRAGPYGESKLARFHRVTRALGLNVALRWKLLRLTAQGPVPHSVVQFATELGRARSKVSPILKDIADEGMFNRYGGTHGRAEMSMTWVRADDPAINFRLGEKEERSKSSVADDV